MYYPYLRGRQNELLALYELLNNNLISDMIIPIIEPIKVSSTLIKTLELFVKKKQKIMFICNPEVGTYDIEQSPSEPSYVKLIELLKNDYILKTFIINSNSVNSVRKFNDKSIIKNECINLVSKEKVNDEIIQKIYSKYDVDNLIIPDESSFKRIFNSKKCNIRIMLADRFNKKDRNADYLKNVDEFFSDDHIFYKEYGFDGFSDYSIIGEEYYESGFSPYAIAIHIVYFNTDNSLRIFHFVSDSNEDIQNPAKKFYECLKKMFNSNSVVQRNNFTSAMKVFEKHYKNKSYPGLGVIKKLSIIHHIELVNRYLNNSV